MTKFAKTSTSTEGKLGYEAQFLNPKILPPSKGASVLTMVGCADGLHRHLMQFRNAGYENRKIIIVDFCPEVVASLKKAIKNNWYLYGGIRVILGDYVSVLKAEIAAGTVFDFLDYDGTQHVNEDCFELVGIALRHAVQLHIVVPVRTCAKSIKCGTKFAEHVGGLETVWRRANVKKQDRPANRRAQKDYQQWGYNPETPINVLNRWAEMHGAKISYAMYQGLEKMHGMLLTF